MTKTIPKMLCLMTLMAGCVEDDERASRINAAKAAAEADLSAFIEAVGDSVAGFEKSGAAPQDVADAAIAACGSKMAACAASCDDYICAGVSMSGRPHAHEMARRRMAETEKQVHAMAVAIVLNIRSQPPREKPEPPTPTPTTQNL